MGMFDFLKVTVVDKAEKAKAGPHTGARVHVDSRSYPIAAIGPRGFTVEGFDGSLVAGQKAKVTISVDEPKCRFTLPVNVMISSVEGSRMSGEFSVLPPETERLLKQYADIRKARR